MKKIIISIICISLGLFSGCMTIVKGKDFKKTRFLIYTNPDAYIPYSEKAIQTEGYKKAWTISADNFEYASVIFNPIGKKSMLISSGKHHMLVDDVNKESPVIIEKELPISNPIVLDDGILGITTGGIKLYSKKDLSLIKSVNTTFSPYSSSSYAGYGYGWVTDSIVDVFIEDNYLVYYCVNFKISRYAYSYRNNIEVNNVTFNLINMKDWSLITTDTGSIVSYLGDTGQIFAYKEMFSLVDNGKYAAFTLGDGENHHCCGYFALEKNVKNTIIFDTASNIVNRFPKDLHVVENEEQKSKKEIEKGKKEEGIEIDGKRVHVLGYKMLKRGPLLFVKTVRGSDTYLYSLDYDLKKVYWKHQFKKGILVDDGILYSNDTMMLIPGIYSDGGAVVETINIATGKTEGGVIPVNLYTPDNKPVSITDWTMLDNGAFIIFSEREHTLTKYVPASK